MCRARRRATGRLTAVCALLVGGGGVVATAGFVAMRGLVSGEDGARSAAGSGGGTLADGEGWLAGLHPRIERGLARLGRRGVVPAPGSARGGC